MQRRRAIVCGGVSVLVRLASRDHDSGWEEARTNFGGVEDGIVYVLQFVVAFRTVVGKESQQCQRGHTFATIRSSFFIGGIERKPFFPGMQIGVSVCSRCSFSLQLFRNLGAHQWSARLGFWRGLEVEVLIASSFHDK